MDPIEQFLHEEFGLSLDTLGRERALQNIVQLMTAESVSDVHAYLTLLRQSADCRRRLLDVVTVPESWFFRDDAPFEHLRLWAAEQQRVSGKLPLRILSLPCAGGEEPYSIAITLFEAGLAADQFRIDAIDVNPRLLERAKAGQFAPHSFRGVDLDAVAQYFRESPGAGLREIVGRVRDQVDFAEGNLFQMDQLFGTTRFDVIFCRNLLIYFSPESQSRALRLLQLHLNPQGLLFLGHAEAGKAALDLFQPSGTTAAFAFTKRDDIEATASLPPDWGASSGTAYKPAASRSRGGSKPRAAKKPPVRPQHRLAKSAHEKVFTELQSLADSGQLTKAARQCDYVLDYAEQDAGLLYLCGVVNEACGDHEKACSLYRRALEVDPKHRDVMVHLAVTLEARGQIAEAQRLKQAADRLEAELDEEGNDGG